MSFLKEIGTPIFNAERLEKVPSQKEYIIEINWGGKKETINYYDLFNTFSKKTVNCRLTSVSKWSVRADWEGILWDEFVTYFNISDYKYVYFESYGGYNTTVFAEDMNNPRILIATHVSGEEIEFEYGGPVRMIIPNLWGYKSCKWLNKIYFIDEYIVGYWEGFGYDDRGLITPAIVLDVNSKKHKRIEGGEVTEF